MVGNYVDEVFLPKKSIGLR